MRRRGVEKFQEDTQSFPPSKATIFIARGSWTLCLCHRIACSTFNRIHNITHYPLLFALIAEHVLPSTVQWQAAAEKSTRTAPPSYGEAGVTYRPYKPHQKEGGRGDREGGGHGRRKSLQGDRGRRKGESAGGPEQAIFARLIQPIQELVGAEAKRLP